MALEGHNADDQHASQNRPAAQPQRQTTPIPRRLVAPRNPVHDRQQAEHQQEGAGKPGNQRSRSPVFAITAAAGRSRMVVDCHIPPSARKGRAAGEAVRPALRLQTPDVLIGGLPKPLP